MYIPGFITALYLYIVAKKSSDGNDILYPLPTMKQLYTVMINVLYTDLVAVYAFWFSDLFAGFSIFNLIMFFLIQDVYFYSVHRLLHKYAYWIHKAHHEIYGPFFAWHASIPDHILVNIMSVAVSFWLFPNTKLVLLFIITLEVYTSVNGHTFNSPHYKHHQDVTKRLGSQYLIDRFLGSY